MAHIFFYPISLKFFILFLFFLNEAVHVLYLMWKRKQDIEVDPQNRYYYSSFPSPTHFLDLFLIFSLFSVFFSLFLWGCLIIRKNNSKKTIKDNFEDWVHFFLIIMIYYLGSLKCIRVFFAKFNLESSFFFFFFFSVRSQSLKFKKRRDLKRKRKEYPPYPSENRIQIILHCN